MAKRYVLGPAGARKLRALFNGRGESGSVRGSAAPLTLEDEFALPFAVQWAQSADGGSGSWIIWLPSDELVIADGVPYDPTEDLTAVGNGYPEGWYVLDDEMLDRDEGGTLYLNVEKVTDDETDEESVEMSFSSEPSEETDAYSLAICEATVNSSTGERAVKSFVSSSVVFGCKCVKSIVGDDDGCEIIDGNIQISGQLDPNDSASSCGLVFTTVSAREAFGEDPARPPRIIVDIKDRDPQEDDWGVHEITYKNANGQTVYAHFLGCADVDLSQSGGGGGGGGDGGGCACEGSDYIDVSSHTETDENENETTHKVVSAKINTVPETGAAVPHALLTNDTEQTVSAKKTFVSGQKSIVLDASTIPQQCNGAIGVHELKYKDKNGNVHTYHGLLCDDVDLSDIAGKTIKSVNVTASSSEQVVTFTYTDDSTTEIHIPNGLNGSPGSPGQDGEAPEITSEKNNGVTHVYADGDLIATILDGHTPVITASKSGGVTTIYVDGAAVAQISDGSGGSAELPDKNVVTGVTFAISGGKLVATVSKENLKTGEASQVNQDVCSVGELDVVVSESYSTSTHQFTNERKKIQVIGSPSAAQGQTPFTATPHSSE